PLSRNRPSIKRQARQQARLAHPREFRVVLEAHPSQPPSQLDRDRLDRIGLGGLGGCRHAAYVIWAVVTLYRRLYTCVVRMGMRANIRCSLREPNTSASARVIALVCSGDGYPVRARHA